MLSPRALLQHVRDCRQIRALLRRYDSSRLRSLYWYDLPLARAVSWRGIARVVAWNLLPRRRDEIAGNYGLVNLYAAEPSGDGRHAPAPTVWHCRGLSTRPFWYEEPDGEASETLRALEANARLIAEELAKLRDRIGTHPDNASLMKTGHWSGLMLYGALGSRDEAFAALCPGTARLLESLPLCRSFGFVLVSGMAPGSHVAPHAGSSNLRLRHHLGLEIPEPEAARIRVGDEVRHWRQDRCLAFDDGYEHEVHHEGRLPRTVLVVDVWHPSLSESDVACLSHPVFTRFGKLAGAA